MPKSTVGNLLRPKGGNRRKKKKGTVNKILRAQFTAATNPSNSINIIRSRARRQTNKNSKPPGYLG